MHVRTFEGLTMKDALRQVRQEFGADAVILKTKEKDMPGTKAKTYEITATAAGARAGGGEAGGFARDFQEGMLEWTAGFRKLEGKIQGVSERIIERDHVDRLESGLHELKMLMLTSLREKEGTPYGGLAPEVGEIVQRLQLMGVSETRIAELAKSLQAHLAKMAEGGEEMGAEETSKALTAAAVRWMMKRVKIAPKWQSVAGQMSASVFVGTAGAGKSSVVAKVASQWFLKEKKDIAIISCDNLRIGGSEQMRIFAKVLGVPFEAAGDASEVPALLEKHVRRDAVLIDTAGRSPKVAKNIHDWLDVKDRLPCPADFHLVTATTEKEEQIDQAIKHFARLGIQSLIFTKLDESWSYGEIFNMAQKWSIPLSYFGIGTRIPEDFERATRERVVERIFGL